MKCWWITGIGHGDRKKADFAALEEPALEAAARLAREPVLEPHIAVVQAAAASSSSARTAVAVVGLECTALASEEPIASTALEPAHTGLKEPLECTELAMEEEDPIEDRKRSSFRGTTALAAVVQNNAFEEAPWLDTTTKQLAPVDPVVAPQFVWCLGEQSKASVWCPARMRAPEPHSKSLSPEEQMTLVAHSAMKLGTWLGLAHPVLDSEHSSRPRSAGKH
jgi:hypothetical protein